MSPLNKSRLRFSLSSTMLMICALSPGAGVHAQNADPDAVFQLRNTSDGSTITPRHESGAIVINNKLYAFGGRQNRPVESYDPVTNRWTLLGTPPYEINHFQPVYHNGKVYAIGAFECCYPEEDIHPNIRLYDVATDSWSDGPAIPANRLRGSAGAVKYNNRIYIVGGNTLGHNGGAVSWFDVFDPANNSWQALPDAPTARDHFFATVVGDKLIAASGRQSDLPNPFDGTISIVDIYDFTTGQWSTETAIPTARAGAMAVTFGEEAIYIGGEVATMTSANTEVEAFNPMTGVWRSLQPLMLPVHTGVAGILGDELHVVSGSDIAGGGGENASHQVADLDDGIPNLIDSDADGLTDLEEDNTYSTDRLKADTDGDGLDDGVEVNVHNSDPNKSDSDEDGLNDFDEVTEGTNINDVDTDSDGLSDGEEITEYGTDPLSRDSDADFLPDDHEILVHGTDPNRSDTDSDGLSDSEEINEFRTDALSFDTDDDGIGDGDEINQFNTDPLVADSNTDNNTGTGNETETDTGDNGNSETQEPDENVGSDNGETGVIPPDGDVDVAATGTGGSTGGGSFSSITGLLLLIILLPKMAGFKRRRLK